MSHDYYSPFEIVKLDRFSDEMIKVSRNLVIKMNISLARSAKDSRYFFYREYEYMIGRVKRVSIKRVFDYFLSIEETVKGENGNKAYVRINQSDYYPFWNMINTAKEWFTAHKFRGLYGKKGDAMSIMASPVPSFELPGLPMKTTLRIWPTVINNGYSLKQGISLEIDNGEYISKHDIPIEGVFALWTMFPPQYSLYHEANTMLASLDIPLGTNRVNMNDKSDSDTLPSYSEELEYVQNSNGLIKGRTIGGTKPTLEDLEG